MILNYNKGGKTNASWHQCPVLVRNYLANVTYDPDDYTTSEIANYAPATAVQSNTKPIGNTVGGTTYYNEIPNGNTPFSNSCAAGTLNPLDSLRWINTPTAMNVRDLGGWACDGGTVKYGMLFRGGQPYSTDANVLAKECGVGIELSLTGAGTVTEKSVLGDGVTKIQFNEYAWYSITNKDLWKKMLRVAFDGVLSSTPIYFHCSRGFDRTGTFAVIIEAMLGMSQSDIDKDYEISDFSVNHYNSESVNSWVFRSDNWDDSYGQLLSQINALSGNTFRDKVINFVASLGFTATEINNFRAAMINGTPETVTPSIGTSTITNTLTNVTNSNTKTSQAYYQTYEAELTPSAGYVISSIQVTMGGIDITQQVLDGYETNLHYGVTSSLTYCTINNTKKAVIKGQGYGATLTAISGYTVDTSKGATITITMGGVDVSTYYSKGKIAIPSVTGNIIITAVAVEDTPSYTNLADPTSADWLTDYRLTSSSTATQSGCIVTNYIACNKGDTIRIKGMNPRSITSSDPTASTSSNRARFHTTDASKTLFAGAYAYFNVNIEAGYATEADSDGVYTFTAGWVSNEGWSQVECKYLRFCGYLTGSANNVIITINEPIED